jgi:hypothetical protein
MLAFIWTVTLLGLALWSLATWGLHKLLTIDPKWLDDVQALARNVPFAETIDQWFPGWQQLLEALVDLAQTVLYWVGTNAPLVAWIVWSIGALMLLGAGGVLTLIVSLLRDNKPRLGSA